MEILVTGATGFLGTRLCTRLELLGHRVVRLGSRNCDLTQTDALEPYGETVTTRSIISRPGPRPATSACATRASSGSSIKRSTPTSSPGGSSGNPRPS